MRRTEQNRRVAWLRHAKATAAHGFAILALPKKRSGKAERAQNRRVAEPKQSAMPTDAVATNLFCVLREELVFLKK